MFASDVVGFPLSRDPIIWVCSRGFLGEIDFLAGWLLHVRRDFDARRAYSHDHNRKGVTSGRYVGVVAAAPPTSSDTESVRRATSLVCAFSATCSVNFVLASRPVRVARVV